MSKHVVNPNWNQFKETMAYLWLKKKRQRERKGKGKGEEREKKEKKKMFILEFPPDRHSAKLFLEELSFTTGALKGIETTFLRGLRRTHAAPTFCKPGLPIGSSTPPIPGKDLE